VFWMYDLLVLRKVRGHEVMVLCARAKNLHLELIYESYTLYGREKTKKQVSTTVCTNGVYVKYPFSRTPYPDTHNDD
jgi:hypothetical protein